MIPGEVLGHGELLISLASALLQNKPVTIRQSSLAGTTFLHNLSVILEDNGLFAIHQDDDVVIEPTLVYNTNMSLQVGLLSAAETAMILLPLLIQRESETRVTIHGVTHGEGMSITSFSRSVLAWMNRHSCLVHLSTDQVGFQGEGEGSVTMVVKPGVQSDDNPGEVENRITLLFSPTLASKALSFSSYLTENCPGYALSMLEVHGSGDPGFYCSVVRDDFSFFDGDILYNGMSQEDVVQKVNARDEESSWIALWGEMLGKG